MAKQDRLSESKETDETACWLVYSLDSEALLSQIEAESRTMSMARQIIDPRPQLHPTIAGSALAIPQKTTTTTTMRWRPFRRSSSSQKPLDSTATSKTRSTVSSSPHTGGPQLEVSASTSATVSRISPGNTRPYSAIYDYFSHPTQSFLRPISAIEHYWAMRATVAEKLLESHEAHKHELNAVASAHEERRTVCSAAI